MGQEENDMQQQYTNRRYLDALAKKVMVFDGAMGTSLQTMNLTADDFGGEKYMGCNDYLVISKPDAVEKVHRSFLAVGADVIETCTFRSNRITLKEYQLQDKVTDINFHAAALARKAADEFSTPDKPRFVAGSIGPSGKLPSMDDPEMSNISFDELVDVFCEQASGLINGGVDLLLIETSQDILEVKASVLGVQKAFEETGKRLPIQTQVSLDTTGRMLLGTDISAVLAILESLSINVIGLNCSTGPEYMRESIRYLGENATIPVSCLPNAGLPLNLDGQAVYPLKPQPFSEMMSDFVNSFHINVVGGCCGTTPEHIKLLAETVGHVTPGQRPEAGIPKLSSATQAMAMQQEPAPFFIGERMNTQGSRKFKEMIMAEDFDGALALARQQVDNGAHGLDLCTALTERPDELQLMKRLIKTIAPVVRVPLVIDSTELNVIEAALQTAPGRCLINSTNLEAGPQKAEMVFSLAKKYNAAVICLTIDEQGMAKTADRKLEIARRIHDMAINQFGLHAEDLVFDDLTFTLATGDPEFSLSAIETLEGIKKIKSALPGVLTSLGVSNLSFGLAPAARAVLNSVMLYHAVQAGLDMAIVNPAQITPYADISQEERDMAENLIFNRKPDALQILIEHFQQSGESVKTKTTNQQAALASLSAEERLQYRVVHRIKEDLDKDIDEILNRSSDIKKADKAIDILNNTLLPAMKEVGDKFGAGELILPFVLQSAEVMKKSVSYLENYLERQEGIAKGRIVLATVYGDVHDIGKNLVKTILSNNGYEVVDLGKQVPAESIISKAVEVNATAIGLSALLVSTSKQMPFIINELSRRKLSFPVLIGGAAINQRFGRRILKTEEGSFYESGVFYCKDAFDGLSTMDALTDSNKREEITARIRRESELELGYAISHDSDSQPAAVRSNIQPSTNIPKPAVWGVKAVQSMPLDAVFQHIAKNDLFRLSWGAKNTHGEDWKKLSAEFEQRLEDMRRQVIKEGWLKPRGVYGIFPCQSSGNELVVYDPLVYQKGKVAERVRFAFPRQNSGDNLCLADYFAPLESGIMDTVIFQVVTVGQEATNRFDQLQADGNYSEAYFVHGFSVQMAEAAADYLHDFVRNELGMQPGQGKRYSWGYPSVPELEDHQKVFDLLPAEKELGMSLTSAFQLVPEQSTAVIIHHPLAKYFNIGETRIEQLMKE